MDVKNYASHNDLKIAMSDNATSFLLNPEQGEAVQCLSHKSIFEIQTVGGACYVQAVDICLDHALSHSKNLIKDMIASRQKTGKQLIPRQCDHIVTSNSIGIYNNAKVSQEILHVDSIDHPIQATVRDSNFARLISTTMNSNYSEMQTKVDCDGKIQEIDRTKQQLNRLKIETPLTEEGLIIDGLKCSFETIQQEYHGAGSVDQMLMAFDRWNEDVEKIMGTNQFQLALI